jgi:hypothetical protein
MEGPYLALQDSLQHLQSSHQLLSVMQDSYLALQDSLHLPQPLLVTKGNYLAL